MREGLVKFETPDLDLECFKKYKVMKNIERLFKKTQLISMYSFKSGVSNSNPLEGRICSKECSAGQTIGEKRLFGPQ